MCYFLYGAVNKGVNRKDYDEVFRGTSYHFNIGTKHDVKMSVLENTDDFRITDGCCDCSTAIGQHEPNHEEIRELCDLLDEMRLIRDIKCVYISKNWVGRINKREERYHIDDIDIAEFLSDIKENCLYCIDLYERYC
ncbi:MAG: hypothetical protein E7603_06640 [Ruminococcaceae bacterium]|nr:hypothetical protein [Oscillospiraceae bacterium]